VKRKNRELARFDPDIAEIDRIRSLLSGDLHRGRYLGISVFAVNSRAATASPARIAHNPLRLRAQARA
jgi:hypothetical protein